MKLIGLTMLAEWHVVKCHSGHSKLFQANLIAPKTIANVPVFPSIFCPFHANTALHSLPSSLNLPKSSTCSFSSRHVTKIKYCSVMVLNPLAGPECGVSRSAFAAVCQAS